MKIPKGSNHNFKFSSKNIMSLEGPYPVNVKELEDLEKKYLDMAGDEICFGITSDGTLFTPLHKSISNFAKSFGFKILRSTFGGKDCSYVDIYSDEDENELTIEYTFAETGFYPKGMNNSKKISINVFQVMPFVQVYSRVINETNDLDIRFFLSVDNQNRFNNILEKIAQKNVDNSNNYLGHISYRNVETTKIKKIINNRIYV